MDGRAEPKVKSLAKALNILSCFTIQEPILGVTELANRIGVTKSNIHNILSTFTSMGYLQRLPDGRYTLGLKILEYAFIINQNLGYPNAVYDILVETASRTGEIVYFGLPYGTNVLYLYVAHPADRLGVLPYRDILGETAPFYCTGIGKAILAHMPEEEWLSHIPEERTKYQPNTVTDLDDDLDQVYDELDAMDEDMDELEEYVYGDDMDDEEEDDEDDGELEAEVEYELTCPNCGAVTVVDEDTLFNEKISCPNCGAEFDIEFTECDGECDGCTDCDAPEEE